MKVKPLPQTPFVTADFSDKGGGIDFLGLRLINLRMLAQNLLPGMNNQTADIGIFCLGAWIPWKFRQACETRPEDFTEENYTRFRQAVEVVMAEGVKDGAVSNERFGRPNRRIGFGQDYEAPCDLEFDDARKRTEATSIYAAALYGPSLRYLGFIGYATAKDGSPTWIHMPLDNGDASTVCAYVDSRLGEVRLIRRFGELSFRCEDAEEFASACAAGLHPSAFRSAPENVVRALVNRLMGDVGGAAPSGRRQTTRLIVETLRQVGECGSEDLRRYWYSGLLGEGQALECGDEELEAQRVGWAIFEARQYQRFVLETFLRCFEIAVAEGRSSIEEIVDQTMDWLGDEIGCFGEVVEREVHLAGGPPGLESSAWWNKRITGYSDSFEWIDEGEAEDEAGRAMTMLARWFLRTHQWPDSYDGRAEMAWGGESRISLRWFHGWLSDRMRLPMRDFLSDLYANLVFTQHLRVALSRLSPNAPMQRLRFVLGDLGIVPTAGMQKKIGKEGAPWMADRLEAWLLLLADVGIVKRNEEGDTFKLGPHHGWV